MFFTICKKPVFNIRATWGMLTHLCVIQINMSDLAPEFKSSAISKRLLRVLMLPCASCTRALAPQQPSLRSGGHREGWGGDTSHRFKKWKLCSKNKRQLLQLKPKFFFFLFGTKTKVLYNNTVFDTKTISWNNGWWQRINVFKRTQVIPFFLCKLFSNVWKTETRKYNSNCKVVLDFAILGAYGRCVVDFAE